MMVLMQSLQLVTEYRILVILCGVRETSDCIGNAVQTARPLELTAGCSCLPCCLVNRCIHMKWCKVHSAAVVARGNTEL